MSSRRSILWTLHVDSVQGSDHVRVPEAVLHDCDALRDTAALGHGLGQPEGERQQKPRKQMPGASSLCILLPILCWQGNRVINMGVVHNKEVLRAFFHAFKMESLRNKWMCTKEYSGGGFSYKGTNGQGPCGPIGGHWQLLVRGFFTKHIGGLEQ